MRILIDILHPAHVHFFRHFRNVMIDQGHEVLVTARDKDLTLELLRDFAIPATVLSAQRRGRLGLAWELLTRSFRLAAISRRFRPDVLIGIMGPSIVLVGKWRRRPAIVFYDTENARSTNRWVYPLATAVCTPDAYQGRVRGNHITYRGYHELAYLHPDRFTPDAAIPAAARVAPGERFAIVRFVGWQASHDIGERGLTADAKRSIVSHLAASGRVFVSSEGPWPADLPAEPIPAPASQVHHMLASASIVVGESATMASEAAVLGVPAVFISDVGRGYTDDEERRYGLVRRVKPSDPGAITAAIDSLLATDRAVHAASHRKLLAEKIDTTAWMIDFIEARRWEQ